MGYFTELVLSGLAIGAIYGLMAMSFAVIYKATGIVNFSQGELGMLTAYLSWSIAVTLGTGGVVTVLIALVCGALLGMLCERLIMRPMLGEPVLSVVLVTVGLAVVLRAIVTMVWGAAPRKFEVAGADVVVHVLGTGMRVSQLGVIGVLLLVLAAFWWFLRYSRFGVAMRAVAADENTARLMGISTARVQSVAWACASALAGLAGVFFAVIYGLSPMIYELGLKAFPATVLGGFDAVIGSGFSGLIIGVFENQVGGYLSSILKDVAGFVLILVVLMVRPFGLFGEKRIERV
ncbi:branched-chain amino acid ABC transporter permease [Pseudacidovorax sp. NFM-22]|uniref:branched-chain amino acid ABC transporter permease n=1 Tax=Pseudacidovorax sp. NFM-22 TaxID=2744469 RepID=UPI001F287331|nr:branched-chain amino acid ABC transporter permease [Pseudacidovorax sp. NFM-22]